jgi:ubiquinone/menaquinone biosynthesis C-methylase UbiE
MTFKVMDASTLQFPDGSFDVVNIQLGLHDLPAQLLRKTLAEMKRVAHRVVVITEPHPPKNRLLKVLFRYLMLLEFFEASDWKAYTQLNLENEIHNSGLQIETMRSLVLGLVRVYRCTTAGE